GQTAQRAVAEARDWRGHPQRSGGTLLRLPPHHLPNPRQEAATGLRQQDATERRRYPPLGVENHKMFVSKIPLQKPTLMRQVLQRSVSYLLSYMLLCLNSVFCSVAL